MLGYCGKSSYPRTIIPGDGKLGGGIRLQARLGSRGGIKGELAKIGWYPSWYLTVKDEYL